MSDAAPLDEGDDVHAWRIMSNERGAKGEEGLMAEIQANASYSAAVLSTIDNAVAFANQLREQSMQEASRGELALLCFTLWQSICTTGIGKWPARLRRAPDSFVPLGHSVWLACAAARAHARGYLRRRVRGRARVPRQ